MAAFRGAWYFLSNFYPAKVEAYGITYPTVEHAFVAAKCRDKGDRYMVLVCKTPGDAKRLGKTLPLRADWDQRKLAVMETLLRRKFTIPELRAKLTATGSVPIVEQNEWHDNFWGSCTCVGCGNKGLNHLGRLLEAIRKEY